MVAVVLMELVSFPRSVRAARSYDRGEASERVGRYDIAAKQYEIAHAVYPGSHHLNLRRAVVLHRLGRDQEAADALRTLAGRLLLKENVAEAEAVMAEIERASKTEKKP